MKSIHGICSCMNYQTHFDTFDPELSFNFLNVPIGSFGKWVKVPNEK